MNTPPDLRSPYAPPSADVSSSAAELPALSQQRSGAPKVFGVLSIIFASLVLLGSGLGLFALAGSSMFGDLGNAGLDADKAAEVNAVMGPMAKVSRGVGLESVILFAMSALLLAIGIGQVRYRAWAGRWSVYWGAAGLVCVVLLVAISLLIVSPAYGEMFETMSKLKPQGDGQAAPPAMSGISSIFGGLMAVIIVLFYAPYPAMMLLFFMRDHVRASMTR